MTKKVDLDLTSQLQQIQIQQMKLVKRIISIIKSYEVIKKAGQKLTAAEESIRQKIENLVAKLSQNSCLDQNSIRTLQYQIQALQEADKLDPLKSTKGLSIEDTGIVSTLCGILAEQQIGIKALNETLMKDSKDLETMKYGFRV